MKKLVIIVHVVLVLFCLWLGDAGIRGIYKHFWNAHQLSWHYYSQLVDKYEEKLCPEGKQTCAHLNEDEIKDIKEYIARTKDRKDESYLPLTVGVEISYLTSAFVLMMLLTINFKGIYKKLDEKSNKSSKSTPKDGAI